MPCENTMEIPVTKLIILWILILPAIYAIEEYDMHRHCGEEVSMSLLSAHQLELELHDKFIYSSADTTCNITMTAWQATYTKLMFYFDDLDLNCDQGHLEFFDDNENYRVQGLVNSICGDSKPRGVFSISSRYLLIRYVPRKVQYIRDIFSITITAYSDDDCPSYSHKCDNSRCISKDIACNGHDSCGDGSICDDENESDDDSGDVKKDNVTGVIIGTVVGSLAVVVFIVCVVLRVCCNRKTTKHPREDQYQQSPMTVTYSASGRRVGYSQPVYGVNDETPYPTAPVGLPPTAPVLVAQQANYQITGPELPLSPPSYSELFGQPNQMEPPKYSSDKDDHVYTDLEDASALHEYENSKKAS